MRLICNCVYYFFLYINQGSSHFLFILKILFLLLYFLYWCIFLYFSRLLALNLLNCRLFCSHLKNNLLFFRVTNLLMIFLFDWNCFFVNFWINSRRRVKMRFFGRLLLRSWLVADNLFHQNSFLIFQIFVFVCKSFRFLRFLPEN